MNLWQCALPPLAAAALALPVDSSIASTCKDELDRFESRLYDSEIPATDPELFEELVREAERAALLRDEQRCLKRVAELKEALPESAVPTPTSRTSPAGEPDEPARPAAPVLLVTDSENSGSASEELAPEGEEDADGAERSD